MWHKIWATVQFDLARSLRLSRLFIVLVLGAFPPCISTIAVATGGDDLTPLVIGVTIMLVGVLSLLLWTTPVVYQEMEGRTWTYIAVRPQGKVALLLGKYVMAVGWTVVVCELALTASILSVAAWAETINLAEIWAVYSLLILLGSIAYAALFLVFGVIFHRRAMVLAVAYFVIIEFGVGFVPAIINKITVLHHLSGLAVKWLDVSEIVDPDMLGQMGMGEPVHQHLLILLLAPISLLAATVYLIRTSEYITADEN